MQRTVNRLRRNEVDAAETRVFELVMDGENMLL